MNFYIDNNNITAVDKSSLSSKMYKYGFVRGNVVYNVKKQGKLRGIAGEYINSLANMADIDFEYVEYDSQADLIKAIESGKVDIAFVDFDYENDKVLSTSSPFSLRMIALSNTYQNVSDIYGLSNHKLYLFNNNYYIINNIFNRHI